MKSLRYILGGRPHSIDDCLDYARTHPPDGVTFEATTDEFVGELRIFRQFIGTYQWRFGHLQICCSEIYGDVFLPENTLEQRHSLAVANAKLQRRLEEIQHCGIEVVGADRRFEDLEYLCART